jgi:SAM-dependent methyltransferase
MPDPAAPSPPDTADQAAYWNGKAGETWTALQERIDAVFAPLTAAALDAAAPTANERVLDIGCGCGATVLALAHRVGPGGQVLGLDVSEPMAARARERIAAAGLANAAVRVADAAAHDFAGSGGADLLFSRFGVMFFADPAAAFRNLRRALRPGGRLLFAVWRPMAENGWFTVPLDAGRPLLPPQPPPEPGALPYVPGPFAFADPDRVRGILAEAGWQDVALAPRDVPMRIAPPGQVDAAAEFATRVGVLARALADADPALRARVRQAVADALRPHDGPDGVVLSGAIWLVSARAP